MGCSVHSQHARAESAPTRRRLGPLADRAGREADDRGHGVSAREAYLRPVTNYYHACLAIPVDDPGYRAGVEHYRSLFQRFAALTTPPRSCITGSDRRAWSAGTTCSCRPPGHGPEHLSRHLLPARHRGRRVAALSEGRQTVPGPDRAGTGRADGQVLRRRARARVPEAGGRAADNPLPAALPQRSQRRRGVAPPAGATRAWSGAYLQSRMVPTEL